MKVRVSGEIRDVKAVAYSVATDVNINIWPLNAVIDQSESNIPESCVRWGKYPSCINCCKKRKCIDYGACLGGKRLRFHFELLELLMEKGIHGIHYFIQSICNLFYTDVKMKNSWADLCFDSSGFSRPSKSGFCLGCVYKTISGCFGKNKSLNMHLWSEGMQRQWHDYEGSLSK